MSPGDQGAGRGIIATMNVSLIWAMTDDRVIGINNTLPWRLPADMKWFRQHTLGKPVIMGRATFESLGKKPLPDRQNIVISKQADYQAENVTIVSSIDDAIAAANHAAEIMIIGGASLYSQTLEKADKLYISLVHAQVEGDAWFPEIDFSVWREIERHDHDSDEKNPYPYSFIIMERAE